MMLRTIDRPPSFTPEEIVTISRGFRTERATPDRIVITVDRNAREGRFSEWTGLHLGLVTINLIGLLLAPGERSNAGKLRRGILAASAAVAALTAAARWRRHHRKTVTLFPGTRLVVVRSGPFAATLLADGGTYRNRSFDLTVDGLAYRLVPRRGALAADRDAAVTLIDRLTRPSPPHDAVDPSSVPPDEPPYIPDLTQADRARLATTLGFYGLDRDTISFGSVGLAPGFIITSVVLGMASTLGAMLALAVVTTALAAFSIAMVPLAVTVLLGRIETETRLRTTIVFRRDAGAITIRRFRREYTHPFGDFSLYVYSDTEISCVIMFRSPTIRGQLPVRAQDEMEAKAALEVLWRYATTPTAPSR
jgi:hypothetical protein